MIGLFCLKVTNFHRYNIDSPSSGASRHVYHKLDSSAPIRIFLHVSGENESVHLYLLTQNNIASCNLWSWCSLQIFKCTRYINYLRYYLHRSPLVINGSLPSSSSRWHADNLCGTWLVIIKYFIFAKNKFCKISNWVNHWQSQVFISLTVTLLANQ